MESLHSGGGGGGGAMSGYADSVDSSPRSRGGESWDEPFPSSAAAAAASQRLRLMCSYGGRIVPRPTDKSLCYLGGETRIVVAERHSSLADLHARLARSLPLGGRPFLLKYQLPSEDLDSLISLTTDEDLDNMVDEYDRLAAAAASAGSAARSSRIRLFIFPGKPESAPSSVNSLLDDSKSESWFVDALNAAAAAAALPRGLSTDSASVNCLLGLEDDLSVHSRTGACPPPPPPPAEAEQISLARPDSSGRLPSVPDSPMLETTSSFGSASSAPSLSNLPPIRVRPDDRPPDPRIEDHFAHMNLSAAAVDGLKPPPPIPPPATSASTPTISPTENPPRIFSSDESRPPQQLKPGPADAPASDSIHQRQSVYYHEKAPSSAPAVTNPVGDPKQHVPDPGYRYPIHVPDPSYMLSTMQAEQLQKHHQQHQQQPQPPQQQQQQQYITASPQFLHHPATGTVVQMPSYFPVTAHPNQHPQQQQQQQPHVFDRQVPMYYMPVQQNPATAPAYNLGDATKSAVPAPNTVLPPRTAARMASPHSAPMLIHMPADQAHAYPGMGYHLMHQHPSQTAAAMPHYGYEYADPSHAQMYFAQSTSPPGMVPQYQAVSSGAMAPEPVPVDVKQTRASS